MELLALSLVKTLASTCLKFYLGYLFSAGGIDVDKGALGYKIPSWYMNPGHNATAFYAYGTSTEGDEFASIEDARQQAIEQMSTLLRRSHERIIKDKIKYDETSLKQRRLVELFIRGDDLQSYILNHTVLDKKKIVKVKGDHPELRAFVRLKLSADDYISHQESVIRELRKKLTYQKSEDIMVEMDAEMAQLKSLPDQSTSSTENAPPGDLLLPTDNRVTPTPISPIPPTSQPASSGSVFDAMESELENIK